MEELNSNRKSLAFLISEGNGLLRRPYYDDDAAETLASTGYEGSMLTEVTVPDEKPEELLETLKNDIGRLQRLSFSISQTLAGMAGEVRNQLKSLYLPQLTTPVISGTIVVFNQRKYHLLYGWTLCRYQVQWRQERRSLLRGSLADDLTSNTRDEG